IHTARSILRKQLLLFCQTHVKTITVIAIPIIGILFSPLIYPHAAELNVYDMSIKALFVKYPARDKLEIKPITNSPINKIVWIIDESVAQRFFAKVMLPKLKGIDYLDFNEVASMANCSSQSNAALRWGIDVDNINSKSDMRSSPTVWAYAKNAGYKTTLIDGQVKQAPQNLIWPPEMAMIDEFIPSQSDIYTDKKIAEKINEIINAPGKDFVYIVLRGVHFQYESHYPPELISNNSSLEEKYMTAIEFSKQNFFTTLLNTVEREHTVIVYTSDHGQVISPGMLPHCNTQPNYLEFSVPLLAFLPPKNELFQNIKSNNFEGRSHSQIFPTTLFFMGFSKEYIEKNYDNLLNKPTRQYVHFGKKITPNEESQNIEVYKSSEFPNRK
ncbi:MAG: sulfatase-like hydrolase/transferase, partial [Methylococcaceae bacterium]